MHDRLRVGPQTEPPGDRGAQRVAARPPAAVGAILALQRSAGNQAVAQLMREPDDGDAAAPLLLTDRPWAEIERERRDRMWGGILPGTRPPRAPGRSLPEVDMPQLLQELREPAEEPGPEPEPEPSGPPLLLTNKPYSWKKHDHDVRVHEARKAREQRERDRAQQRQARRVAQDVSPRTPAPTADDLEKTSRQQAETARAAAVLAHETPLAVAEVAAARQRVALLDTRTVALEALVQPPDAITASFMSATDIAQVTADRAAVQAELAAIRAHDAVLAGHAATLAAPGVAQPALAAAYAATHTTFNVAALGAQARATSRAHLTPEAVKAKVEALVDAAKLDPAQLLGRQAGLTIVNNRATKNRTAIEAEITAAVHKQHHPKLGDWLALLQITTMAQDGQLRIKNLKGVAPGPGATIPVHLSLYISKIAAPVLGVNSTADQVLDAVLPKHRHMGAHVTLEYKGAIAPKLNPHYFRGDVDAVRNSYPNDASWTQVEEDLMKRMTDAIAELRIRIQGMLDRKGRDHADV